MKGARTTAEEPIADLLAMLADEERAAWERLASHRRRHDCSTRMFCVAGVDLELACPVDRVLVMAWARIRDLTELPSPDQDIYRAAL